LQNAPAYFNEMLTPALSAKINGECWHAITLECAKFLAECEAKKNLQNFDCSIRRFEISPNEIFV